MRELDLSSFFVFPQHVVPVIACPQCRLSEMPCFYFLSNHHTIYGPFDSKDKV